MWRRRITNYQTPNKLKAHLSDNALQIKNVLKSNLGLAEDVVNRLLIKNGTIGRADPEKMIDSIEMLKSMDLSRTEIAAYPDILLRSDFILNDNRRLLAEIGLKNVTAYRLHSFESIMSASVKFNEQFNFLPRDINIFENIFDVAKIDMKLDNHIKYHKTDSLLKIHTVALIHYMQQRLQLPIQKIIESVKQKKPSIARSIRGIEDTLMIVERRADEEIISKVHCLGLFPEQIKSMIGVNSIYGIDIMELSKLRYGYSDFSVQRCMRAVEVLRKYNIPEYVVKKDKSLLFRNADLLAEELRLISSITTDRTFFDHMLFGYLIRCIRRLKIGMDKQKIDFYKTVNDRFVDFFLNGFLFKHTLHILPYLASVFNVTIDEVRKAIASHPQRSKVRLDIIYKNISFLVSHGFTHDDIFRDIYVVFYSLAEIKDILQKLNDPTEAKQLGISTDLTKSQKLRLIVYFIEQKCGFNGEGAFLSSELSEYEDSESVRMEAIIDSCLREKNLNLHDYFDDDQIIIDESDDE